MKRYKEKYSFLIEYEELDMKQFISRYHFEKKDEALLAATGRFLAELITVQAAVRYLEEGVECVVTLGKDFDRLSELVAEQLLLSYCVECMGMEFLSKSYEKINELVFHETGKWIGDFYFLGEGGMKEIEESHEIVRDLCVEWKNGMLHPLKSVVFTANYKERKEENECGHCEQCKNVTCSFRKTPKLKNKMNQNVNTTILEKARCSYGISHIFREGKR